MGKRYYIERNCEVCGKIFTVRKDNKTKTCSVTCRAELRRVKAGVYKKCQNCGEIFKAKKKHNTFCSNKCVAEFRSKSKTSVISCLGCGALIKRPNCHIRKHTFCSVDCRVEWFKKHPRIGEEHPNWKGGVCHSDGYILIKQSNGKYIGEHRSVMGKHLGRKLSQYEIVHHIDGNKTNNDIGNLAVVTRREHVEIHRGLLLSNRKFGHSEALELGVYETGVFVYEK